MDALGFLDRSSRAKPKPLYVLAGDEDFLKRQVIVSLREQIFGKDADEFGLTTYPGEEVAFATVRNDLETLPFLSPRRLVVVENADPFVTKNRPALEKYVGEPAEQGTLVLEVKSWPSTTKLSKLVPADATITCKGPAAYKLPEWCMSWSAARYGKQLSGQAARLLVDLIGAEMGQLDQELAKLAVYVGSGNQIDTAEVDALVGHQREENTFKIFDTIGAGHSAEALAMLDRMFDRGEDPVRILGAFSYQLRRLAQLASLRRQGLTTNAAMDALNMPPFARQGCDQQLRHLGRRTRHLYDWLVEADLGIKGGSTLAPRTLLERLVVRLARKE